MLARALVVPVLSAASLTLTSPPLAAQTTRQVPSQFPTIQAAIEAAATGDTVLVAPGVYNERIGTLGKELAILSTGGPGVTTIDGTGVFEPLQVSIDGYSGVVVIYPGQTAATQLEGFTITGATTAFFDQAVRAAGATPVLRDCVLRDNFGSFGAYWGGGLLEDCSLLDNYSVAGGGTYGDADLVRCLVSGNTSGFDNGGGVLATGPCAIVDSLIVGNAAGDYHDGGGVYGPADLLGCLVAGNTVDSHPAAVTANGAGLANVGAVDRCTIVDNQILGVPCTGFPECEAAGVRGATSVTNSIVRGNAPGELAEVGVVSWSNVEGGAPGVGNFDADPLFADAPNGDYALQGGSPCVDAGDPSAPLDADGSVADVGAFPLLGPLTADGFTVSVSAGGAQAWHLDAGAVFAGELYWIVGSASGTAPGLALGGGVVLPLNVDAYFLHTLAHPNQGALVGTLGVLDGSGAANAAFALPAGSSASLAGLGGHHAAVVLDAQFAPALATNAVPLTLLP